VARALRAHISAISIASERVIRFRRRCFASGRPHDWRARARSGGFAHQGEWGAVGIHDQRRQKFADDKKPRIAEEARSLAEDMRDPQAKETMLRVAKQYDQMAVTAELLRQELALLSKFK
jgi:hypothetical protein